MTTKKKPLLINCSAHNNIDSILPRQALFSSRQLGWKDLLLEYYRQPAGQHPEVYSSGHAIIIITNIAKQNQIETICEGKTYKSSLTIGAGAIVPAETIYQSTWYGERELIAIGFNRHIFPTLIEASSQFEQANLMPQLPLCDPLISEMGMALKRAIAPLRGSLRDRNLNSRLYVESITNALAVHLVQYYSNSQPIVREYQGGLSRNDLNKIIEYIHANLDLDLSVRELASLINISSHYFSTLFKKSTGLTPHKYIIQTRIERAKILLLERKMSLVDIAQQVGFANQGHLNQTFKRLVGVTPKQFRQR